MEPTVTPTHIGQKIARIRELKGMKQETLADEMGCSQQKVSRIESSENVEDDILEQVAKILGVTPEAIKNFDEEKVINYFNTFNDSSFSNSNGTIFNPNNCTFNPLDKLIEAYAEKEKLYERLLEAEKEKVKYLECLLGGKG